MIPFGSQTITLNMRGSSTGTDRLGHPIYSPVAVPVPGCSIQPVMSTETLGDHDGVITRWRLFAPSDVPLTAVDSITYGGQTFSIDGDPEPWPDWYGGIHHIECYLRKATG